MAEQIKECDEEYSDAFKAELDRRYPDYVSGKVNMLTAKESKQRINQILDDKSANQSNQLNQRPKSS